MKLTTVHRRRLVLAVIMSLLACALMPVTTAFFSGGKSTCHSVSDDHSSADMPDATMASSASSHHLVSGADTEHLCDEDPAPLPTELGQLLVDWTPALLLFVLATLDAAMHTLRRRGSRRYASALRSHLAIGRIQV